MDPFMVSCYMMTSQKRLVEPSMRLEFNDVDDEHQAIMPQSILRSLSLEDGSNSDMSSKSTAPSSGSEESFVYDHIYKGIKGFLSLLRLSLGKGSLPGPGGEAFSNLDLLRSAPSLPLSLPAFAVPGTEKSVQSRVLWNNLTKAWLVLLMDVR